MEEYVTGIPQVYGRVGEVSVGRAGGKGEDFRPPEEGGSGPAGMGLHPPEAARGGWLLSSLVEVGCDSSYCHCFIYRHLPSDLRQRLDPEDVLQEAYRVALNCEDAIRLKVDFKLKPWFEKVLLNRIYNLQKVYLRAKRFVEHQPLHAREVESNGECEGFLVVTVPLVSIASTEPSPEESMSMRETIDMVLDALRSMPPKEALMIIIVCFEDKRLHEAAEELGLTSKDASRRLYRAKRRLRSLLQEDLGKPFFLI